MIQGLLGMEGITRLSHAVDVEAANIVLHQRIRDLDRRLRNAEQRADAMWVAWATNQAEAVWREEVWDEAGEVTRFVERREARDSDADAEVVG